MTVVAILLLTFAALSVVSKDNPDASTGLDALALLCGIVLAIWWLVMHA